MILLLVAHSAIYQQAKAFDEIGLAKVTSGRDRAKALGA
jgi:hypothetical protein